MEWCLIAIATALRAPRGQVRHELAPSPTDATGETVKEYGIRKVTDCSAFDDTGGGNGAARTRGTWLRPVERVSAGAIDPVPRSTAARCCTCWASDWRFDRHEQPVEKHHQRPSRYTTRRRG
jgi:hypothetical protein